MAAEVLSGISSALAQTYAPELTRAWNREARVAKRLQLKMGGGQGGGQNVAWDVEFSGAGAASFAEGSDVGGGELLTDKPVPAVLSWGMYRSAFQLSNLEINAAAANIASASMLEDIVGERFIGSITKILSLMNADIFTGTGVDGSGNPNIVGLNTALAATGTYAGINKATYSEWAGNVSANSGIARSLTTNLLASAEQLGFVASSVTPDELWTSAGVHTKYENLFESQKRIVADSRGVADYRGSMESFDGLFWRGRQVQRDRNCPTNTLYMLNFDYIDLRVLPWAASADGISVVERTAPSSNGDRMEATQVPFHVYPLGRTGSGVKFVVEIYAQLRVKRTNAHVLMQDISEV